MFNAFMFNDCVNHFKRCLVNLTPFRRTGSKPRGKRSYSSAAGSLFLEAAIITPVAFFALLGTAEVLNIYVQRGNVGHVANSIATAIQQKPDITAQEMYEFIKSLGGGVTPFAEVKISDGSPYNGTTPCSVKDCRIKGLEVRIGSSATPVKEPTIRSLAPSDWSSPRIQKKGGENIWGSPVGEGNPTWPNSASPFVADPNQDTADDFLPYYVGVRVVWQNRPVFKTLGFASMTMTQFAGVLVKGTSPANLIPHLEMLPNGSFMAVGGDLNLNVARTSGEAGCSHSISVCGIPLGVGGSVHLGPGQICEISIQFGGECAPNSLPSLGRTDRSMVTEYFRGGTRRWTVLVEDWFDWDWNDSVWEVWGSPVGSPG